MASVTYDAFLRHRPTKVTAVDGQVDEASTVGNRIDLVATVSFYNRLLQALAVVVIAVFVVLLSSAVQQMTSFTQMTKPMAESFNAVIRSFGKSNCIAIRTEDDIQCYTYKDDKCTSLKLWPGGACTLSHCTYRPAKKPMGWYPVKDAYTESLPFIEGLSFPCSYSIPTKKGVYENVIYAVRARSCGKRIRYLPANLLEMFSMLYDLPSANYTYYTMPPPKGVPTEAEASNALGIILDYEIEGIEWGDIDASLRARITESSNLPSRVANAVDTYNKWSKFVGTLDNPNPNARGETSGPVANFLNLYLGEVKADKHSSLYVPYDHNPDALDEFDPVQRAMNLSRQQRQERRPIAHFVNKQCQPGCPSVDWIVGNIDSTSTCNNTRGSVAAALEAFTFLLN